MTCLQPVWYEELQVRHTEIGPDGLLSVKSFFDYMQLAAGKHAEFEVEYDEPSGTTTVKTRVANDTPLTETAVWTGTGAWATVENWRESVKPTETKKAVFGSDATGTEVELAAGDLAGALEFSGGNYRLWGGARGG